MARVTAALRLKRISWFILLWLAGVVSVAAAGGLIRLLMGMMFI